MLEELAKHDELWRFYALKICQDKELADDLVGDMYIKLHDKDLERIYDLKQYVYRTLQSVFLNIIKKENRFRTVSIEEYTTLKAETSEDKHLKACLENMKWFDREILLLTHEFSLRKSEELVNVNHCTLNYHKHKALKKLKILYHGKK